jgi:hypothetical protein
MPMTNAERQKKFRERQLLNNKDEYLHIQSQYKKKQYRKKYKDGELEETDNEDEIKDEIKEEFIILKPIKKRQAPLNKTIIKDETKKIYIKSLSKIYNSYYHKEITDEFNEELIKLLSISAFVRGRFFLVTPPVPVVPVSLVVIEAIYGCSYGFTIYLLFRKSYD